MRYLYVIVMLLAFATGTQCQQLPFYTQYVLNPFVTNPALAGIEDYWDLKLSYRTQWQGMEGGPKTIYATFQGPLKHVLYSKPTTSTIYKSEEHRRKDDSKRWMKHKPIIPHAGLGFTVLSDQAGPIHRYAASASYAYHIGLSSEVSIGAGLSGGVQGVWLDPGALDFGVNNPSDPAMNNTDQVNEIRPDISLGLWLYARSYFVGLSAQNVVPSDVSYSGTGSGTLVPHYLASAGYKMALTDDVTFLPSFMLRMTSGTPVSFDINGKFQYRDVAWIGASYRHQGGMAWLLGMNINTRMSFGYSYDLSRMNGLAYSSTGTHEVIIGILFRNGGRVRCPSDFW